LAVGLEVGPGIPVADGVQAAVNSSAAAKNMSTLKGEFKSPFSLGRRLG
jgi:Asp/Glu/hydantoin racemase